MFEKRSLLLAATLVTVSVVLAGTPADARAAGRIVCWKDDSGKVIGCGDRVPLEYQESATKELDSRGITRKTTETAEEAARRRAEEQERAKEEAEERRRLAERRRQDRALLATYGREQEIDERRDREIEVVEAQIRQLDVALKNMDDRRSELEARREHAKANDKLKKSLPVLQQELERLNAEERRLRQRIASREKTKQAIRSRFEEQKERYRKLKGGASASVDASKPY